MRILEKHPVDTSPLARLEELSGVDIPDPLEPIREIDLDVDKIRADADEFRAIADELEGLIDELSSAEQELAPGAGAWDSQAAVAASGTGEKILTVLKWILAIILIVVGIILLLVDTILFVVLGLLKIIEQTIAAVTNALASIEALSKLVEDGPWRKLLRALADLVRGTVIDIIAVIGALASVVLPGVEKAVQGVRWLAWQLLLWAAQLVDKPKAEKVAREKRDSAFDPILED